MGQIQVFFCLSQNTLNFEPIFINWKFSPKKKSDFWFQEALTTLKRLYTYSYRTTMSRSSLTLLSTVSHSVGFNCVCYHLAPTGIWFATPILKSISLSLPSEFPLDCLCNSFGSQILFPNAVHNAIIPYKPSTLTQK